MFRSCYSPDVVFFFVLLIIAGCMYVEAYTCVYIVQLCTSGSTYTVHVFAYRRSTRKLDVTTNIHVASGMYI